MAIWRRRGPTANSIGSLGGSGSERNEVEPGEENVVNKELCFFSDSRNRIDTCMDNSRPSLAIGIESIKKSLLAAKRRAVELR